MLSLDTTCDVSWLLPQFFQSHDQFSPVDKLQDFGQNILSQDPSLMFSDPILGMSELPTDPTINQVIEDQDQVEMKQQLAAMKEAMRRLEEKIAASS